MRKIFAGVAVTIAMALAAHTQGYFNFNNVGAAGTITIAAPGSGEGSAGAYPGSSYRASLYYSITPISGRIDPSSLILYAGEAAVPFLGTTGGSPGTDGAGLFDGGALASSGGIPLTTDGQIIYVETAVWFAGAGATSLATAEALGYNIGWSSVVPVRLATGTDTTIANLSAMPSFSVGAVPEPSTVAVGGLGALFLLLFGRRK